MMPYRGVNALPDAGRVARLRRETGERGSPAIGYCEEFELRADRMSQRLLQVRQQLIVLSVRSDKNQIIVSPLRTPTAR
jgi:hypothetical protein